MRPCHEPLHHNTTQPRIMRIGQRHQPQFGEGWPDIVALTLDIAAHQSDLLQLLNKTMDRLTRQPQFGADIRSAHRPPFAGEHLKNGKSLA